MAVTITKPPGGRTDDVRSLRFRFRTLTFSGNYATGGEVIQASQLGLKRIQAVLLDNVLVGGVTGTLASSTIAATGASVTIKQSEDAAGASGTTVGIEKTNAEAYVGSSVINALFIGY